MKTLRSVTSALGLVALLPLARAADAEKPDSKTEKVEKRELRVLAAPEPGGRVQVRPFNWMTRGDKKPEMENVTYLGVITSQVSATLTAQLGLAAGSGLVVNNVEENSPATAVLKQHDILLKLDDQLLVDQRQLSVLIRQKKEGDEVTLTYIRGGKQATAKVKLGKHEAPKISALFTEPLPGTVANAFAFGPGLGGGAGKFELAAPPEGLAGREDVDHVLSLIQSHSGEPFHMWIDRSKGPGFRAMSVNTGNSNMVYSDDQGSLELTIKDGKKNLVAKSKKGDELFAGPVTTPEERKAMPDDVRERLEHLEGMQDVTFRTDGDFQGAEARLGRPLPRGISLPLPPPERAPLPPKVRPPLFF